ncbi:hypothetical protein [Marinicella litoralis]|uniref:Uncharacterized protein n=1 Tax=Marinicella litoralis TaxID=644220 RepID=A0A4R6XRJ4_9GAMM|nr:hypothetical protein [Marinicella litoralis]TDR22346.1 hypothetical protein C8D91_0834 [Marinicella litoralis]
MLLRRITKHVTEQNWFAVSLDFVIVVFGVFLGIQIGDWNEERLTRERTVVLTERLADDFGVDVWLAYSFATYHEVVINNAKLVLDDLSGRKSLPDNALLVAAFRATQFNRLNESSTYTELVSSGGYDLLAKSELGRIATVFYESEQAEDIQNDGKSSDYRRLYRTVIPIDVQLHAAEVCGDRNISVTRLMNGENSLSYDCQLSLPAEQLSEAVAVLRTHPDFADMLRRRIANLSMQISDFTDLLGATKPYRASHEVLAEAGIFMIYEED